MRTKKGTFGCAVVLALVGASACAEDSPQPASPSTAEECKKVLAAANELANARRNEVVIRLHDPHNLIKTDKKEWFGFNVNRQPYRLTDCPATPEDVEVNYFMVQGKSYKSAFTYRFKSDQPWTLKEGLNPHANIILKLSEPAPVLDATVESMFIGSLSPDAKFSNKELELTLHSIAFRYRTELFVSLRNLGTHYLTIRELSFVVDGKAIDLPLEREVRLAPKRELANFKLESRPGTTKDWYTDDVARQVVISGAASYLSDDVQKSAYGEKSFSIQAAKPNLVY